MGICKVAVLDDEPFYCDDLKDRLEKCFEKMNISVQVDCYESADELKARAGEYRIIFVDYKLSDGTGMDLCYEIRRENSTVGIVFVSGYPEYAFETFKVRAFRFLKKPVDDGELAECVSTFFAENEGLRFVKINFAGEGRKYCDSSKILYIHSKAKHSTITFDSGEKKEAIFGISDVADTFGIYFSARVSRYEYVFFKHVEAYNPEEHNVYMKDGAVFDVSRTYRAVFEAKWMEWLAFKGNN